MSFKEMLKQSFSDPKTLTLERYKAAKFAFIVTAFLFFLNFYFVWANYYSDIFSNTLWTIYILLVLSIVIYVYFLVKMVFVENPQKYLYIIIFILMFISFIVLLFPLVFSWGLQWVFDLIK